jgi:O-antigen/teichoic acid export membrane protein
LTAANFVGAALTFVQGIFVARWLGPELYGVAALVMSYPNLVYTFFDARSTDASVKFLTEFHARNERERVVAVCKLGYIVDCAIASLAVLVVVISARWAAQSFVNRAEAAWLIITYAAAFFPRALVGTSYSVLTILGRFDLIAWVETFTTIVKVALVLSLVVSGWQVSGVVWGNAIATLLAGLLYGVIGWVLIIRMWGASPFQGSWQALKGRQREILGFLGYSNLNALFGMIPKQLDVLLLGYFRSPTESGYYKLAKSLTVAVGYLVGPLQSVTYPEFARLSAMKDKQALRQKIRRLAFHLGVPLALVVLAGAALVPFVLPILVGNAYLPSVAVTQVLFVGSAVWLTCFWLRPVYFSLGSIKLWTVAMGTYAIAFIVLGLPLTIALGSLGMGIASSLVVIIIHSVMVARLVSMLRKCG